MSTVHNRGIIIRNVGSGLSYDEDTQTLDDAGGDEADAVAAHEAASDPHAGYQKESEKGQANGYAGLGAGGLVPIDQLASGTPTGAKFIRDDGTLQAITGFQATSEKDQANGYAGLSGSSKLTGSQQTYGSSANTACEGNDARLSAAADLATHAAASDPHTGYQKESEKGGASGYAGLDSGSLVPVANLATGTPTGTKFLRDDRSWQEVPSVLDINGLTESTAFDPINDYLPRYSAGASGNRKSTLRDTILDKNILYFKEDFEHIAASYVYRGGITTSASGGTFVKIDSLAAHPGIGELSTGTATDGAIKLGGNITTVNFGGGRWIARANIAIPVLSDGTQTFTVRCAGYSDGDSQGEGTDAVYVEYIHSQNSGNFTLVCRSNGSETSTTMGVPPVAATWIMPETRVESAGTSAQGYVNGTVAGSSIGTNVPNGVGRETGFLPVLILKSAGATARTVQCDMYDYTCYLTAGR